ncbi:hypothetical protein [Streptomyces sp. NPDC048611]|uniref:hypothetical protein n=1 Tax=Streptomyces sp. NPDC048611 TaxID=3155635 RepID=UPI00343ADA67
MSGHPVPDRFDILAFHQGRQAYAVLRWEGGNHDFTVTADGPWGRVTGRADDCFEALTRIREQIEPQGWLLGVNGSRRDTWPSGMCRGTGGFLVYWLRPGLRPTSADRVQTFHPAPPGTLATVAEQIAFEKWWSQSLDVPPSPAPAVPPVTEALRAQAAQQRGGYVYAIDPHFDPNGAVPPHGIIGGWSVDSSGRLVSFTHNPNYRKSGQGFHP